MNGISATVRPRIKVEPQIDAGALRGVHADTGVE
jgi:hypothetical protein